MKMRKIGGGGGGKKAQKKKKKIQKQRGKITLHFTTVLKIGLTEH